jgi:hypothetical protein
MTGQIKENLNQVFSRYTRCKQKDYLGLKAIKVDTHITAKYTRLRWQEHNAIGRALPRMRTRSEVFELKVPGKFPWRQNGPCPGPVSPVAIQASQRSSSSSGGCDSRPKRGLIVKLSV